MAELAFYQDVVALVELGCVPAPPAEDDEFVPLGARDVLARFLVLVGRLGCQFKDGEV